MRSYWLAVLIPLLCAPAAYAQFRWVDADGKVGFGDKPPPGAQFVETLDGYVKGAQRDPQAQLPYQLQRTMKEFPVTLYTMSDCTACDAGRALLKQRAIPFAERTVRDSDDVRALKKLTGSDQMPAFQVGPRMLTGFNSATWNETLDLAGYPHAGQLPADWVWPAPKPLTAKPEGATAPQAAAPPAPGAPK
jgi:glutaredoxin